MKLCICGIGGTGKRVACNFLENVDLDSPILSKITKAEYVSPGMISGVWIDLAGKDSKERSIFRKLDDESNERKDPRFIIAAEAIPNNSELHKRIQDKCGTKFDVWMQGTVRDAQFLKVIYELFDTDPEIQDLARKMRTANNGLERELDGNSSMENNKNQEAPNPLFDAAWNLIKPYTLAGGEDCQGILFIVSLGGGTGTGFINPIIRYIRTGGNVSFPVFALGILTKPGYDPDQNTKEGKRFLSAISGLYDMLTMENGADGIILMDEDILAHFCPNDEKYAKQNKFIYEVIKPMILDRNYPETRTDSDTQAIQKFFSADSNGMRPIIVPFYWSQPRKPDSEKNLVRMAIKEGKLFDCNPEMAEKAMVFCRGYINSDLIEEAIKEYTNINKDGKKKGLIWVNRKLGEKKDEILILLRNPYGQTCEKDPDSKVRTIEGTLEHKLCKVIDSALDYMEEERILVVDKDHAGDILDKFFFGKDGTGHSDGFAFRLREAKKRLYEGEKNFFTDPIKIFENASENIPKEEIKSDTHILDEQKIVDLVNKVVDERLAQKEAIKRQ